MVMLALVDAKPETRCENCMHYVALTNVGNTGRCYLGDIAYEPTVLVIGDSVFVNGNSRCPKWAMKKTTPVQ